QEGADDIAALAGTVTLLGTTAPLVLGVLGIVLIVIGLLLLRGGKDDEGAAARDDDVVPAGSTSAGTSTQVLGDANKSDNT
ncbi:MAG: hypothetical protein KDC17_13170, partial [Actinobacteria bacterium]|nr:hypothetical protein [Actinomycetota bacterium]